MTKDTTINIDPTTLIGGFPRRFFLARGGFPRCFFLARDDDNTLVTTTDDRTTRDIDRRNDAELVVNSHNHDD